jgi:D-3-phosphoglycerate dehydrogenase
VRQIALGSRGRLLVVADDYMPAVVFGRAFDSLRSWLEITYVQLEASPFRPATASELKVREFLGDPGQLTSALDRHSALIVHAAPVTAEVLDAAPALAVIGCARGGPVNIDVEAATERGVAVLCTPGKNSEAVAELTIAFLLSLARGLPTAISAMRERGGVGLSTFDGAQFLGTELAGQIIGLVGLGHVGKLVAARASSLGMTVIAADPYLDPADTPAGVVLTGLDEVLAAADFVSLHARVRPDNAHLIGRAQLRQMKPTAFLLNTAREQLVDEAALIEALDGRTIAGAALDVIQPAARGAHPLTTRPDVIVTPHIGGATAETLARGARMLADDLARVLQGTQPRYQVNNVPIRTPAAS